MSLPDAYWVEPGRLMAGEYPGGWNQRSARRKLRALIDAGVRTFVDLTEDGELERYDEWLALEATAAGVEVMYHRHAIRDLDVPTPVGMRTILDLIESAIEANAPVYVHCWCGIGRTGTVVCCWLVERGLTGEQALVEIAQLRDGIQKRLTRSPEMDGQLQFVKAWRQGRRDLSRCECPSWSIVLFWPERRSGKRLFRPGRGVGCCLRDVNSSPRLRRRPRRLPVHGPCPRRPSKVRWHRLAGRLRRAGGQRASPDT